MSVRLLVRVPIAFAGREEKAVGPPASPGLGPGEWRHERHRESVGHRRLREGSQQQDSREHARDSGDLSHESSTRHFREDYFFPHHSSCRRTGGDALGRGRSALRFQGLREPRHPLRPSLSRPARAHKMYIYMYR